jgi:hypothetical protein
MHAIAAAMFEGRPVVDALISGAGPGVVKGGGGGGEVGSTGSGINLVHRCYRRFVKRTPIRAGSSNLNAMEGSYSMDLRLDWETTPFGGDMLLLMAAPMKPIKLIQHPLAAAIFLSPSEEKKYPSVTNKCRKILPAASA